MKPKHYRVQTPEGSFSWIGGETKLAGDHDVWLCTPGGERVLRVPANCVRESSREETTVRIEQDRARQQSAIEQTERIMKTKSTFASGRHFFIVQLPDGTERTWIGGPAEPSEKPGHVWLCHGNGERVVELPESSVTELTKFELAQRIADQAVKTRARN